MSGNRGKGRPKGALNKATRDIKELARAHGPEVVEGLVRLFREADSDAAKIAAAREILDRGYGKATQPVAGDDSMPAIKQALTIGFFGGSGKPG
jgi:hypothetical protein